MAMATKLTVIFVFLSLLAISSLTSMALASKNQGDVNRLYGENSLRSYQCPSECSRRCSKTQYKKPCLFFCNKCCNKCLCVPPGYYGNKGVCACYNNWKTKRGGPKCP